MPEQLIVITGAGASADATNVHPLDGDWRPPLVVDLFAEREAFTPILSYYPDAQTLAPDIRVAVRTGSVGFETYLRDHILNSASAYDRRRYRAIPLYLQHLLWEVGQHFTPHPVNYDRLINGVLRSAEHVVFVTLNYDTLLDGRLERHAPIESLDDYVRPERPWSLVKLHGSVNWMKEIRNPIDRGTTDAYLANVMAQLEGELELSEEIVLRRSGGVLDTRWGQQSFFYPALSVPLGPQDELNCPPSHLSFLRERLGAVDGLDILSIGYSGLDSGLLQLLRESGNSLRSLTTVNQDGHTALEAATRLVPAFGAEARPEIAYPGSFEGFAQSGGLEEYLASLD